MSESNLCVLTARPTLKPLCGVPPCPHPSEGIR